MLPAKLPIPTPRTIPIKPPNKQRKIASNKNWDRIFIFFAPTAFLIPISFVLSVTDTSIMFIIPIPAASNAIIETTRAPILTPPVISFICPIKDSLLKISKSFSSPGPTFLMVLIYPIAASMVSL